MQNQYGATSADRNNPVIKTFGLAGCLALVLYDPEARIAALAHISPSVLMTQKMQERAASQRQGPGYDHLMSQINKLFYCLENNASRSAKYSERKKLGAWIICGYGEFTQAILQRMKWGNIQVGQEHIFTQPGMDKIAFDTRNGQLYRLTPP